MKCGLNRIFMVLCFFAVISTLNPTYSHAMPAAPHFLELQQSDGTTFVARQWGDEHSHGWETKTGHTIVLDQKSKSWTYAVHDKDGNLVSSSILVKKTDIPPVDIQKNLRPLKSSPILVIGQSASSVSPSLPQLAASVTGTKSLPVILIGFSDAPFTKTKADFDNLLFGNTGNSMKNYYRENSYNQLTVNGGTSGVYGPVTSNNIRTYYGGNNASGADPYPGTLVYEAVSKAAAGGFKFAPFVDQTKSCDVDVVVIAHQGTGEEAGFDANDIWSHSWNLNSAQYYGNSSNGEFVTNEACTFPGGGGFIKVNKYVIQPELATPNPNGKLIGVGVFAHEYGHALGLPDLYDTDNSSEGAGNWTLMAGGAWLGPLVLYGGYYYMLGDSPAHLDPWSKFYLGWITPTSVTGLSLNQPVAAASSSSPNFYAFGTGTPTSGEYFLLENRQKTGFDSYLNGSGLLVWHIDGTMVSNLFPSNSINNNECKSVTPGACASSTAHYGVSLIQADNLSNLENKNNRGDVSDPFYTPKTLTDTTAPNSKLWSGATSGVSITSISASTSTMTASMSYSPPAIIQLPVAIDNDAWSVTTGGNGNWSGQSAATHDGVDAAQSAAIADSQSTWMQTTVTGPGTLSFWWKVSSESGWDYLRFYVDDVEQAGAGGISGEVGWSQVNGISMLAGSHTIKWIYSKDSSANAGSDAGWVDQVVFSPSTYPLTFTFAGTGYGSVNSAPSGISCTGTSGSACVPTNFIGGSAVILSASTDSSSSNNSIFTSWTTNTTACPGTGTCSVTINGPVNVTGNFTRDKLVNFTPQVSNTYGTILEALSAATIPGQIIQVRDNSVLTPFDDALTINKSVTLKGGFASGFATNNGYTTTNGKLTIGNGGFLKVQRIIIR